MSEEIEDRAIAAVAKALSEVPQQRAMAAAIMRHSGNALAELTDEEQAAAAHSRLARRHVQRMGRQRR